MLRPNLRDGRAEVGSGGEPKQPQMPEGMMTSEQIRLFLILFQLSEIHDLCKI